MPIYRLKVTTTGVGGSAVGSAVLPFDLPPCLLEAVKVDYHASAPNTTDLTLVETKGLGRTLLTLANNATDGTYYPRHTTHDTAGADAGSKTPFVVEGPLQVSLAQCDALIDAVTVDLLLVENRNVD